MRVTTSGCVSSGVSASQLVSDISASQVVSDVEHEERHLLFTQQGAQMLSAVHVLEWCLGGIKHAQLVASVVVHV